MVLFDEWRIAVFLLFTLIRAVCFFLVSSSLFEWAPADGWHLPGLVVLLCSQQQQLEPKSWNFQFTLTSAQSTTTPSILVLVDDWLTCSADATALAFAERHALFSTVVFGSCVVIPAPALASGWCGLGLAFDPLTACGTDVCASCDAHDWSATRAHVFSRARLISPHLHAQVC
jgi:hypothetical protein